MGLLQVLSLPLPPALRAASRAAVGREPGAEGRPVNGMSKSDRLAQAAVNWRQAYQSAGDRIAALKSAIASHYAGQHPALLKAIDRGVAKLDGVLANVDRRLADVLANASKAGNDAARAAELKSAKALLAQYIGYVKGEPLVAHMDQNPFGVKTDLRVLLAAALTDAAKAIG
jgi:hypothetical protein